MSIILNEDEQPSKYYLLRQSLKQDLAFRMNRNASYTYRNQKPTFRYGTNNYNYEEISEWTTQSDVNKNKKSKQSKFFLPDVKYKRKNHNLEELTKELLKYEQFDIQNMNENNKFRLTLLRQMTKINFKKQKTKQSASPKTINLKLKFPDQYQKHKQQNQDITQYIKLPENQQDLKNSFYIQRTNRGLIPSIKKHLGSSFIKKQMLRSQSEHQSSSLPRKINLVRSSIDDNKNNIIYEMKQKIDEENIQEQKIVKLIKLSKKIPVNFLSYSNRKNKSLNKIQDLSKSKKKNDLLNVGYLKSGNLKSFYPHLQRQNSGLFGSRQARLSECLLMNNKVLPYNKVIT